MKKIFAAAAIACLMPVAAFADGHSEVVLAATHAGFAASSTTIEMVHKHLHHTLNCLVGRSGDGFDAKEINPCANAGSGAITDVRNRTKRSVVEAAADKARAGLKQENLAKAQKDADEAEKLLKSLE